MFLCVTFIHTLCTFVISPTNCSDYM